MKKRRHFRLILAFIAVTALFSSCRKNVDPDIEPVYIQYQPLVTDDDFRPLQNDVVLTDYLFQDEPEQRVWLNGVYVDSVNLAGLANEGKVVISKIHVMCGQPVQLSSGWHILSDGGVNPVVFNVGFKNPLIWINSNYPVSADHDEVKIVLKNYPKYWNLKWWFLNKDVFSDNVTEQDVRNYFKTDLDGADYDAGFLAGSNYTFRAPTGYGFLVVKAPNGTYQVQRIIVGVDKVVTFTAP